MKQYITGTVNAVKINGYSDIEHAKRYDSIKSIQCDINFFKGEILAIVDSRDGFYCVKGFAMPDLSFWVSQQYITVEGDSERRLISKLSQYEHDRWSHWMKYMFSKCSEQEDGTCIIPADLVIRWKRQMNTEYSALPSREQESDIDGAKQIMEIVKNELQVQI